MAADDRTSAARGGFVWPRKGDGLLPGMPCLEEGPGRLELVTYLLKYPLEDTCCDVLISRPVVVQRRSGEVLLGKVCGGLISELLKCLGYKQAVVRLDRFLFNPISCGKS